MKAYPSIPSSVGTSFFEFKAHDGLVMSFKSINKIVTLYEKIRLV